MAKQPGVRRLDIPRFSLDERELRWGRIREMMHEKGYDALVLPYNTGHWGQFQADVQYVAGMGGNDSEITAVFPLDGEVTAWVRSSGYISKWLGAQDWVSDIRDSRGVWGPAVAQRLKELDLGKGNIGVVGLSGYIRAAEGTIPYAMMQTLIKELPEAKFVNATEDLVEVRSVKSEAEIATIRRAAEIAEIASEALLKAARVGVPDALVYAAAYNAMMTNGGEIPTLFLWGAAPENTGNFYLPTNRPLEAGDVISSELEAKYTGYRAQVVHPVFIEHAKDPYPEMFALSVALFNKMSTMMKPGVSMGELMDTAEAMGKGAGYTTRLVIHGRGCGEDRPLITGAVNEKIRAVTLKANNVFILKPPVSMAEPRRQINFGDTVAVTENGAQRLGKRPAVLRVAK